MPNAISAVGTVQLGSFLTSPAAEPVNPSAVGNLIAMFTYVSGTSTVSSITGGNCAGWVRAAGPSYLININASIELWLGTATATGSANATVTATTATSVFTMYQQFAGGGANTAWAVDGAQSGITTSSTATTTMTFKNLVPGGSSRLYLGWGINTAAVTSSPTSGFTFQKPASAYAVIYNPNVSASVTPTVTQTSGRYETCAALITAETVAPSGTGKFIPFFM